MDKFYVKSKRAAVATSSAAETVTPAGSGSGEDQEVRTSGVGRIYSKIRHKIEDNFTPRIGGRLYRAGKHSMSMNALSTITSTTGKYTLTRAAHKPLGPLSRRTAAAAAAATAVAVKLKEVSKVDDVNATPVAVQDQSSPYASCYVTPEEHEDPNTNTTSTPATGVGYVDSDEEEQQLSLNLVKRSLEDEIFEELEKAAHDEHKLSAVLSSFDRILSDYQKPPTDESVAPPAAGGGSNIPTEPTIVVREITTEAAPDAPPDAAPDAPPDDAEAADAPDTKAEGSGCGCDGAGPSTADDCGQTQAGIVQKSQSSSSISSRKWTYRAPDSPSSLPVRRPTRTRPVRSNSVRELTTLTKIPIFKASTFQKRRHSFSSSSPPQGHEQRQSTTTAGGGGGSGAVEKCAAQKRRSPEPKRHDPEQRSPSKTASPEGVSAARRSGPKVVHSTGGPSRTASNTSLTSKAGGRAAGASGQNRSKSSDELLDKCLEKGKQILRKVESMNRQPPTVRRSTSCPKRSIMRSKSVQTANSKVSKENLATVRRRQLLRKLNYANEEKVVAPPLESCRIIPPVLGLTSDKHSELLVSVVQAPGPQKASVYLTPTASEEKQRSVDVNKKEPPEATEKDHESDSGDSGHISNENGQLEKGDSGDSSGHQSVSATVSTSSLCESADLSEDSPIPSLGHQTATAVKTTSSKISELLEKFEGQVQGRTKRPGAKAKLPRQSARVCTTVRVADVEAVRVIRTQVEYHPNYTKEVTMRLH